MADVTVVIGADNRGALKGIGEVDKKTSGLGDAFGKMGKIGAAAIAGLGVAGIGAAAGLFKLGSSFDDAFDKIAIGTGATGDDLKALEKNFKNVFTSVPTDMGKASTAIADLNTRTGATGKTLEEMSKTMLEMTRLTGGDLDANIRSVSRLMGDWDVSNEDSTKMMDKLFKTAQATGIGIDQLGSQMVQFGAPLRQLGFGFDTSAALLAKFEKEGVNAELVMGSLRIALGKMAREGEPAEETLNRTIEAIKNAGSVSEANAMALELFGARAGPDMAAAIREGRFAVDDLVAMMQGADGAIMSAAESTADFGEKWTLFKNKALTALEPVATKVLELSTEYLVKITAWLEENGPKWVEWYQINVKPTVDKIVAVLRDEVPPALQAIGQFVQENFQKFKIYYESDIRPALQNIRTAVEQTVKFVIEHWEKFDKVVGPILDQFALIVTTNMKIVKEVLQIIIDLLGGDFSGAWTNTKQLVSAVVTYWVDTVRNGIELLKGLGGLLFDAGKILMTKLWDGLVAKWLDVKSWLSSLPQKMLDTLGDLGHLLYDIGRAIITGLWDGMKAVWGDVSGWLGGLGGDIKGLKGPIEEDAKLLEPEGKAIVLGLWEGMRTKWDEMTVWIQSRAAALKQQMASEAAQAASAAQAAMAGAFQANAAGEAAQAAANVAGSASGFIGTVDIKGQMVELFKNEISGLLQYSTGSGYTQFTAADSYDSSGNRIVGGNLQNWGYQPAGTTVVIEGPGMAALAGELRVNDQRIFY